MNDDNTTKVQWHFWFIAVLMLVWNAMGCINFVLQMNPEMVASYRESERAIIEGRPLWATIAFAIAVFGGALGCVLLLVKKIASYYLFVISFLGVFITMAHTLSIGISFGAGEMIGIILMPLAVAAYLIWYSKRAMKKGWIR